jgi:hypothetical protein
MAGSIMPVQSDFDEAVGKYGSTAVYALAAVSAGRPREQADEELSTGAKFMVSDSSSPYYGGFGNVQTGEFLFI